MLFLRPARVAFLVSATFWWFAANYWQSLIGSCKDSSLHFFFFFGGTKVWSKGFAFAKQALYYLRHQSVLLWLFCRWVLMNYLPSNICWSQTMILQTSLFQVARITGRLHFCCHMHRILPRSFYFHMARFFFFFW
jgi:hypothetical protein